MHMEAFGAFVKVLYTSGCTVPSDFLTAYRSAFSAAQLSVVMPQSRWFMYTMVFKPWFRAVRTALRKAAVPSRGGRYSGKPTS